MSMTVFEFVFKCKLCPQIIKVRTDPEIVDYVFTEGARRIVRLMS
jgi:hypothetical protein